LQYDAFLHRDRAELSFIESGSRRTSWVYMFHVPKLLIAEPGHSAIPAPDVSCSSVNVWRGHDHTIVATGHTEAGMHWMHWPNLGAFSFAPGAKFVTAFSLPGAPVELIEEIYERGVLPMALQALGFEALHASALPLHRGAVGLFATSETGKSTFAYELAKRGHTHWADDSVLFDTGARDPTSLRLPFRVRVHGASGQSPGIGSQSAMQRASFPHSAPIYALCLLERQTGEETPLIRIEELNKGDAFASLLMHAHCFNPHDCERRERMIRYYLDLTARVPVLRMRFRPSLTELPPVLDCFEAALERMGAFTALP